MATREDFQRLLRVKRTQVQMIYDRGYDIPDNELLFLENNFNYASGFDNYNIIHMDNLSYTTFRSKLSNDYERIINNKRETINVFYVALLPNVKIIKNMIKNYGEHLEGKGWPEKAIYISPLNIAKNYLSDIKSYIKTKTQTFFDKQLVINPTRHVLYSQHELLTDVQTKELLSQLNTSIKFGADTSNRLINVNLLMLPKIKISDPIVRYFDWPLGKVVKIYRDNYHNNKLVNKSVYPRVIVD